MKMSRKIIGATIVITALTFMFVPILMAATGSSGERPEDATPPYGLKVEGDAKGTKLNGSIMVEYYGIDKDFQKVVPIGSPFPLNCRGEVVDGLCCGGTPDITAKARVVLRLRQGSEGKNLYTYFADVGEIPLTGDPADIQMAIQSNVDLKNAILEDFFDVTDGSMTVALRSISEFGVVPGDIETDLTGNPANCTEYDIDAADPADQCTEQDCGGSRILLADIVIAVR